MAEPLCCCSSCHHHFALTDDGEAQEDFFDLVEDKTHFVLPVTISTQLSYTKYGVHKTV